MRNCVTATLFAPPPLSGHLLPGTGEGLASLFRADPADRGLPPPAPYTRPHAAARIVLDAHPHPPRFRRRRAAPRAVPARAVPHARGRAAGADGVQPLRRADRRTTRPVPGHGRSEEHTSELQSLMRLSYAVFCLKKKNKKQK